MSLPYKFCPQCAKPLEQRHEGERPRPACPDRGCGFVLWENPTPVVAAIVEHEGRIILARNKAWPGKFFALITGFLEKNEKPDAAVLREVEEELGLKAHTPSFVGHYVFDRMNQLIIAYHVLADGVVRLGEELAEYKHIEPAKLRPWPAATGLALRDWMLSRGHTPPADDLALASILNFLKLDERIASAGQPRAEQFLAIRAAGYETVINLALPTSSGALPDEAAIVEQLGMRYRHIPVVFEAPQRADFERFCAAMDENGARKVFVHCAMNLRVSAFLFLYRVRRLGMARADAAKDLRRVWEPDPVWARFLEENLR